MTTQDPAPGGIDTTTPNVARIYDYLLGGKDNFAVDREAAKQLIAASPDMAGIVRDNRSFIGRAVRFSLRSRHPAVHRPRRRSSHPDQRARDAQQVAPDARVAYIDNDPWSGPMARRAGIRPAGRDGAGRSARPPRSPHPEVLRLLTCAAGGGGVRSVCISSPMRKTRIGSSPSTATTSRRQLPGHQPRHTGTAEDDPDDVAPRQRLPPGVGAVACPLRCGNPAFLQASPRHPGVCINEWRPDPRPPRSPVARGGVGRKP